MCREMSKPSTMSRCKLQKYFKLNEEETIKSRCGRLSSRKETFPEGQEQAEKKPRARVKKLPSTD